MLDIPWQSAFNICVNIHDETDNSEKFGLHEPNPRDICKILSAENFEKPKIEIGCHHAF